MEERRIGRYGSNAKANVGGKGGRGNDVGSNKPTRMRGNFYAMADGNRLDQSEEGHSWGRGEEKKEEGRQTEISKRGEILLRFETKEVASPSGNIKRSSISRTLRINFLPFLFPDRRTLKAKRTSWTLYDTDTRPVCVLLVSPRLRHPSAGPAAR